MFDIGSSIGNGCLLIFHFNEGSWADFHQDGCLLCCAAAYRLIDVMKSLLLYSAVTMQAQHVSPSRSKQGTVRQGSVTRHWSDGSFPSTTFCRDLTLEKLTGGRKKAVSPCKLWGIRTTHHYTPGALSGYFRHGLWIRTPCPWGDKP